MSEPRRGRPPSRFAIRRVRLVGFHNFVDETIELEGGGHLFLLGDNGSGKTTVLDAVHLVLTGTQGIELNAAARIAGGRDGGRSLQGIVLRYDAERGVVNDGGAIAYAIVELADESDGAVVCVGLGIEATTMEADVTRWGILTRRPLADVPLVDRTLHGARPLSREALRAKLGKLDVFAKMSDFRRALSERLFGSAAVYEEVCRFWSMAKAYREIVTKARDFAGLFARMLPAPNRETFTEILRSARALDELEDTLKQLDEQHEYVRGLADQVETIRGLRETGARYRYLRTLRRLDEGRADRDARAETLVRKRHALASAAADSERARGAVAIASNALATAQAADSEGLGAKIQTGGAQVARDRGELARAQAEEARHAAHFEAAERAHQEARKARSDLFGRLTGEARAALEAVRSLDAPLGAVHAALDVEEARFAPGADEDDTSGLPPLDPSAARAASDSVIVASAALRSCERRAIEAAVAVDELTTELAAHESRSEELPAVAGFVAARDALAAAGIVARPVYELLEPKGTTPGLTLAAIEALAGDHALAAFVVDARDRDRARTAVMAHAEARLFVRAAEDATLPSWAEGAFSARSDADALACLATILAQPASLGALAPPDALGDLEHRGEALRIDRATPRLLGEPARRAAHEARLRSLRAELERAKRSLTDAAAARETAQRIEAGSRTLVERFGALRSQAPLDAFHAARAAAREVVRARDDLAASGGRTAEAKGRLAESEDLLGALRARAKASGLEEIEQRIAELERRVRRARDDEQAAMRAEAALGAEVGALEASVSEKEAFLAHEEEARTQRAVELRRHVAGDLDDRALDHYVRVTQRGDQFKSVGHIDEALAAVDRQESAACAQIESDGSRGVRSLTFAGRFGFTFHAAECRVTDRRDEPLASVLANIERTIGEQRDVVNERTRELMDRLVMGALARELQEQVERLYRTVREMNLLLEGRRFGTTRYAFKVTPRADRAELVSVVRSMSLLDEESRKRFRTFVDERLEELRRLDDETEVPELLDYRRWFDYRLSMRSAGEGDTELTRELRALGSGGEQGVPNYLLVLALARLVFDTADARVRPLMFDEAFYGIDAGRRDELLRFATELGLQIVVASPDQDGVTPGVRRTTTLFLVKDQAGDVHLAPYHYWNDAHVVQRSLLAERPEEPAAEDAVCVVGAQEAD